MFLESSYTALRQFIPSAAWSNFSPICSICSSICIFHIIFGPRHLLFFTTSKCNACCYTSSLSLLEAYPYIIAFHSLKLVSLWFLSSPANPQVLGHCFSPLFHSTHCSYHCCFSFSQNRLSSLRNFTSRS